MDDSPTFVAAVKQCLALLHQAEVIGECHDGLEALKKIKALSPDLVLLDVSLPGMGGVEVARTLRCWPQSPDLVFLSMHEAAGYQVMAEELGALAYVNKADFVVQLLPIIDRMAVEQAARAPAH